MRKSRKIQNQSAITPDVVVALLADRKLYESKNWRTKKEVARIAKENSMLIYRVEDLSILVTELLESQAEYEKNLDDPVVKAVLSIWLRIKPIIEDPYRFFLRNVLEIFLLVFIIPIFGVTLMQIIVSIIKLHG